MVRVIIFIVCILPMLLNAQGFGSFAFDQPFLAKQTRLGGTLTNGLMAYWKMDEEGNLNREDATGNNRDLTDAHGSVAATTAKLGLYSAFISAGCGNGNNSRLYSTDSAFGGTNTFTFCFWAGSAGDAEPDCLVSRYGALSDLGPWTLYFRVGASALTLLTRSANNTFQTLAVRPIDVQENEWVYYSLGYNSTNATMWIKTNTVLAGELDLTATGGLTNYTAAASGLSMLNWVDETYSWCGVIDEAAYWDRKLTDAEISQLYNSGNGLPYDSF